SEVSKGSYCTMVSMPGRQPNRRYQQYHRLIDATPCIWCHSATSDGETMTETITAPQQSSKQAFDADAIRPFRVNVPDAELVELRRRITATRWPARETVNES